MKFLISLMMLFPVMGYAKTAAQPSTGFNVIVNMGNKRAWYKVWQDKGGKFYAVSNGGKPTVGVLSDQNFYFLNQHSRQVASMPAMSTSSCQKSNIMLVKDKKVVRSACLGAKNQTTMKMTELAGLLSMLQ